MQAQAHKTEALKALGVILRGIELFGKDQSFLPCQRLFLNSLLWRDSVHFLQERGCVIIENRKGTFVAPKFKDLEGLKGHLEATYGISAASVQLPDIRPNYPLRVPHSGGASEDKSNAQRSKSISPHVIELLEKALGSVDNPSVDQISRIARNLNLSEAQVYNFINRNRPKKRRYSTSDILRPNRRFDFAANPFSSSSNNSDDGSEAGVRSEGASDEEADPAARAAREERKREIEQLLSAVYQHGHDELYAPVEQNCVSILAKLREHSDDEAERAAKRSRPNKREQETLERAFQQSNGNPEPEVVERVSNMLQWEASRVKRWFLSQRQLRANTQRRDDSEPRGVPADKRAPESLPSWWVDQAARQQQLRAQQMQFEQSAHHAQVAAAAAAAAPMAHFAHPFAMASAASVHGLPQFSAAFSTGMV